MRRLQAAWLMRPAKADFDSWLRELANRPTAFRVKPLWFVRAVNKAETQNGKRCNKLLRRYQKLHDEQARRRSRCLA